MENTDYDILKKRGFLRQKQEGFFVVRTRMINGVYSKEHLDKLSRISLRYAKGFVHATTRQGLEIPFIKFEDIDAVEREIKAAGIAIGTSGPRLRTTTVCPGNNWCKSGLIDTFSLAKRIEELDVRCGLDLPHKFKINISGCPNACTRPQAAEIGIHGVIEVVNGIKQTGYAIYLGGCGGRSPREGFKLDKIFNEEEALTIIKRIVEFFKTHAKPRQRFAFLIEEMGREKFLQEVMLIGK